MYIKIDYINVKIPILRLCRGRKRKSKKRFPPADHVSVGSVVITNYALDIGLVAKVRDGKPAEIFARYNSFSHLGQCDRYGGADCVRWFDTGIQMSLEDWIALSNQYDAAGFHAYWESRLGIKD